MTVINPQILEGQAASDHALELCVQSANTLLSKMVKEFRFVGREVFVVRGTLEEYTHAYRQYGVAQIMSDYFKSMGIPFRAGLEDPIIEHSANIRTAALAVIKTLRDLDCDTQDINSISDDLKKHGEAARLSGNAEGIVMLAKV